jgi:ribonuclease J
MTVRLTAHRSAHEIGGNCIEVVASGGSRLLLDIGRRTGCAIPSTYMGT